METMLEERESYESLMARTQPLVDADLGPRRCGVCGRNRAVGRRAGDAGRFVCLAGCDRETAR